MAEAHLGETIDIHAGGNDLMFPHHENEIAQSTCAHGGKIFARYWLHNGMLTFGGRKMSKSLGNVMVLHELLERIRLRCCASCCCRRTTGSRWTGPTATLQQARATLDGWYGVLRDRADVEVDPRRHGAGPSSKRPCSTTSTRPRHSPAIAALADRRHGRRHRGRTKRQPRRPCSVRGALLGLLQQEPEAWFKQTAGRHRDRPEWVQRLLEERASPSRREISRRRSHPRRTRRTGRRHRGHGAGYALEGGEGR